jgi:hypothetical protein
MSRPKIKAAFAKRIDGQTAHVFEVSVEIANPGG